MIAKKINLFNKVLIAILLLGLLIRIIGTYPGYPQTHVDEPIIYATSAEMVLNNSLNPFSVPIYKFAYPGLIIYLYAFLFKFFFIPVSSLFRFVLGQSTSQADILGRGFINAMFWSRYLNAFLSWLSVPLVYVIGKKMFNRNVGLIAAFFVACNYRHVLSSHFGLLDSTNATFALLALYFCLRILENPSRKHYVFTGASVALSLATKLNFFSILPFAFVHSMIAGRRANGETFVRRFFSLNLLWGIVSFGFVFLIFNPYLPFNLSIAKHTLDNYNLRIGLFFPPLEVTFPSIWYLYEIGFGKIMSLLFVIGVVFLIRDKKHRVDGALLSFFIVLPLILLLYLSHGGAYVRYFASITPFAVLISAYAFWVIVEKIRQPFKSNKKIVILFISLVAIIVSFDQIKNSLILDYFAMKPWNSSCVENWMIKNIKTGDKIVSNNLVSHSKQTGVSYSSFSNTEDNKTPFSLSELQDKNIDYVVANIEDLRGRFNWWLSSSAFFWGIPVNILDNSFDGLALKELSRYIVKECIKPWQSTDNNFIVVKIPKRSEVKSTIQTRSYNFKPNQKNFWKTTQPFYSPGKNQIRDKVSSVASDDCTNSYCLKIEGKNNLTLQGNTIISEFISVNPGEKYIVKAEVKADRQLDEKTRDGFLRTDFYTSGDYSERKGVFTTVSSRYIGEGLWKELIVRVIAPQSAKYMNVSFQMERNNVTFLINGVKLYKSQDVGSKQELKAANAEEIPNTQLYPLSLL